MRLSCEVIPFVLKFPQVVPQVPSVGVPTFVVPWSRRSVEEKPVPTRAQQLKRLASGEEFDVLVVGGGCTGAADLGVGSWVTREEHCPKGCGSLTGAGVALEAQLRGLKVACVEQAGQKGLPC